MTSTTCRLPFCGYSDLDLDRACRITPLRRRSSKIKIWLEKGLTDAPVAGVSPGNKCYNWNRIDPEHDRRALRSPCLAARIGEDIELSNTPRQDLGPRPSTQARDRAVSQLNSLPQGNPPESGKLTITTVDRS